MSKSIQLNTLLSANEFKMKEKGSVFIGYAASSESESQAEEILSSLRKKYYDATHNCYAYKIFNGTEKYSDDGEPNGTAGIRILNALNKFRIVNTIVVVTRYFGGTKLGIGALGKAYYDSAYGVLESSEFKARSTYNKISVKFEFDQTKNVHHFLNKFKAANLIERFDELPVIECCVFPEHELKLIENLKNSSAGKTEIQVIARNILI